MENIPRLDILLYAHDGRGLGHVSRTIAIGLALRRRQPALRVLVVTGSSIAQELIGEAPLDWLKLPSYATVVESGKSRGIAGKSNFEDREIGKLRGEQIRHIVNTYHPRVILADHSPQGKHGELVPALEDSHSSDIVWILGLRAVIGDVGQVNSNLASSLFSSYYTSILWYGDSNVLGTTQSETIHKHYNTYPIECGYVSRLLEFAGYNQSTQDKKFTGTISVPWFGEKTPQFLHTLYKTLEKLGEGRGKWKLYLDSSDKHSNKFFTLFEQLSFCSVEKPGRNYITSLTQSCCAIIYGGYNSLIDVLSLSLPSLVILRDMQDNEQQQHLRKLLQSSPTSLVSLAEDCDINALYTALLRVIEDQEYTSAHLNLNGAENAAIHLNEIVLSTHRG